MENKNTRNRLFEKFDITWKQIGYLLLADTGYALALNLFYVGNNIAAGGIAGIGTLLNYFFGLPIGIMVFLMSVPIAICAIKIKGKTYVAMSILTIFAYSVIVDALSFLPCITDDKIVAVVFGGILYGASSALAIKAKMSTGGSDLLAKILITKFKSMSIGSLLMCIDGSIVVLAMFSYGSINAGIYAILAIAVSSIVTDKLNSGFNRAHMFYIFADKNTEEITSEILYELGRGVTAINGTGKYSNQNREILMVIVKPSQTPVLKDIVKRYDPTAFIVQVNANEIIGEGFENIGMTESLAENKKKTDK